MTRRARGPGELAKIKPPSCMVRPVSPACVMGVSAWLLVDRLAPAFDPPAALAVAAPQFACCAILAFAPVDPRGRAFAPPAPRPDCPTASGAVCVRTDAQRVNRPRAG